MKLVTLSVRVTYCKIAYFDVETSSLRHRLSDIALMLDTPNAIFTPIIAVKRLKYMEVLMNNNLCWILILLACCGSGCGNSRNIGCGCGDACAQTMNNDCGCGLNNGGLFNTNGGNCACDILWIIILCSLFCGCGNNSGNARNMCC